MQIFGADLHVSDADSTSWPRPIDVRLREGSEEADGSTEKIKRLCFLCSELGPWRDPISEGTLVMPIVSFPVTSCERQKTLLAV